MPYTVSRTISDDTLNRIIQIESAGNPNAQAATSSALGLGQFLNATWLAVIKEHKPDWSIGRSREALLPMRKIASRSIEMLARHTEDNARIAKSTKGGDLYLAHFAGAGAARNILAADPDTPVIKVIGAKAVEANKFLRGKTCGWTRDWAASVMAKKTPKEDWVKKYYVTPELDEVSSRAKTPDRANKVDEDLRDDYEVEPHEENITPHGEESPKIYALQSDLDAMGYHEVGIINGVWGGGTVAALGAFLNDRHVKAPADMRVSNLEEVERAKADMFTRPVAPERAEAKPAELAKKNETVLQGIRQRFYGFWGMIGTGIVSLVTFITDKLSDFWDALATPRRIFGQVPGYVWVVLVFAALFFVWYSGRRVVEDTTEKYRERKLLQ